MSAKRGAVISNRIIETRKPVHRFNWKHNVGGNLKKLGSSKDYLDLDTRFHSVPSTSEMSPQSVVSRLIYFQKNKQYDNAAALIRQLPTVVVKSALPDIPIESLVEDMPKSLPAMEALYTTVGRDSCPEMLFADKLVWRIVGYFAQQDGCLTGDIRFEFCGPFVDLSRNIMRVVRFMKPSIRKKLQQHRRQLEKAIEGMGHHGLVGTSDESLTSLHDSLKLEFEKVVKSYTAALTNLQDLCNPGKKEGVSSGVAPIQASHQRQLSISVADVQDRLIKNKSLLNCMSKRSIIHPEIQGLEYKSYR